MTLDEAVRAAKIKVGLDPDQKYPPMDFYAALDPEWHEAFWDRQIELTIERLMGEDSSHD